MNCFSIFGWFGFCFQRVPGGISFGGSIRGIGTAGYSGCWPGFIKQDYDYEVRTLNCRWNQTRYR